MHIQNLFQNGVLLMAQLFLNCFESDVWRLVTERNYRSYDGVDYRSL